MVQQVTKGIKISVITEYVGTYIKDRNLQYSFSYSISIENQSKDTIQLISRHWEIKDSLDHTTVVQGEGVIGQKPILLSGEKYSYSSGCLLQSPIGAMSGHYTLVNFLTMEKFHVPIPLFNLSAPFSMN